ncbi:MAG: glycerophosphodiester phosphodiesterase [Hyphomonadaceae bacterium]|nr:glycerophosphodiester phosphodiesterase [Hyphomonadaceae bacterium]
MIGKSHARAPAFTITRRTALAGAAAACATRPEAPMRTAARPIVIAHRGASGERPEHTTSAYRRAILQGADYIEPDLVLTRDGVLVCRHENEISETTDVAQRPEFAARKTVKTIDGVTVEGWFTEDFTLQELKRLRCRERLPQLRPANTAFDGGEPILTFDEALDIAAGAGRPVGVYPETKHPAYFDGLGLSHDAPLLAALTKRGFKTAAAPVFIQSFEVGNLERLSGRTGVRLVQLASGEGGPADRPGVRYRDMLTTEGLAAIARYAQGVGVEKALIVPRTPDGAAGPPTDLVDRAHAVGLLVHAWTYRAENYFLPRDLRIGDSPAGQGDLAAEIRAHLALGLDGVFCDFPAIAVAARDG